MPHARVERARQRAAFDSTNNLASRRGLSPARIGVFTYSSRRFYFGTFTFMRKAPGVASGYNQPGWLSHNNFSDSAWVEAAGDVPANGAATRKTEARSAEQPRINRIKVARSRSPWHAELPNQGLPK